MRPSTRSLIIMFVAIALMASVSACGSDTRGTQGAEGAASNPTPPEQLENLTAEQVLERASTALEEARSFEATHTRTYVTEDETTVQISRVLMSSPERVYSYYESSTHVNEDILFDGTVYQRRADTVDELQSARWEGEESQQRSNQYYDVTGILQNLAPESVTVIHSQGRYELMGTSEIPILPGGGLRKPGFTRTTKYVPGQFTAIIDPSTFLPVTATYELAQVTTDSEDPDYRKEEIATVTVEFRSFNNDVAVTRPDQNTVDQRIYPTATFTPAAYGPGIFPTATAAPKPPKVSTPTPTPAGARTPTPYPASPPNLPILVPPTDYSEFQEQIDAAAPADVFEVLPGMIVVYESCGAESDGIVTAKLFDMSNSSGNRGYTALIHIQLSDGSWTAEHPGLTTSAAISTVEESASLMAEIVEHAAPESRGC